MTGGLAGASAGFAKNLYRQQLNFTAVLPPLQAGDARGDGVRKRPGSLATIGAPADRRLMLPGKKLATVLQACRSNMFWRGFASPPKTVAPETPAFRPGSAATALSVLTTMRRPLPSRTSPEPMDRRPGCGGLARERCRRCPQSAERLQQRSPQPALDHQARRCGSAPGSLILRQRSCRVIHLQCVVGSQPVVVDHQVQAAWRERRREQDALRSGGNGVVRQDPVRRLHPLVEPEVDDPAKSSRSVLLTPVVARPEGLLASARGQNKHGRRSRSTIRIRQCL